MWVQNNFYRALIQTKKKYYVPRVIDIFSFMENFVLLVILFGYKF